MAEIVRKTWSKGELLMCRGLLCTLVDIERSPLGFNLYRIQFVDSGEFDVVANHLLSEIEIVDTLFSDNVEEDWDVGTVSASDVVTVATTSVSHQLGVQGDQSESMSVLFGGMAPSASKSRHCHLTDAEIDDVAKSRLSIHTENQTKWAVNLFKGE